VDEHTASNEAPIASHRREAIDTLLRLVAQHHEDEGRELSRRPHPFSLTTLELRQGHLAEVLERLVRVTEDPEAERYPVRERRILREQVQYVYRYLFVPAYSPRSTTTFLIPECFELDPISSLLHEVRLRLTPPSELLTIEQAAEILGIQRTMTYQWIEVGILHPLRVGLHKYLRCERWEVEQIARDRTTAGVAHSLDAGTARG
jgi:excisionase family DNA binding protein